MGQRVDGTPFEGAAAAHAALACMDLTSLGESDTPEIVAALCAKAVGPAGSVAAVCVWPRFASLARASVPASVAVAAVVNFPSGSQPLEATLGEIAQCLAAGAGEIDLVFPYARFLAGDSHGAAEYVRACKRACGGALLKVILESGVYPDQGKVREASEACLAAGADFLKTSTGKVPQGASPEAARTMMGAIADAGSQAGFKASGGVKDVEGAAVYLNLAQELLGVHGGPKRFRIGASSLLGAIEARLGLAPAAKPSSGY